jgi:hypothetical protein
VVLGALVLTRVDLLPVPAIVAVAAAVLAWRRSGRRSAGTSAAAVVAGTLVLVAPWTAVASAGAKHFVPISSGGASNLFIGTYLPGGGTLFGFKRAIAPVVRRLHPSTRGLSGDRLSAATALAVVARRHRGQSRDAALQAEALHNLRVYGLGHPFAFSKMLLEKAGRMWFGVFSNRRLPRASARYVVVLVLHLLLLAASVAGIALGIRRRRDALLIVVAAIVLYSTLANMLLVAESRHNLPLLPILFAAGAAGLAMRAGRSDPLEDQGADRREDPVASGGHTVGQA